MYHLISPSRLLKKLTSPSTPDPIRRQKMKEDKWRCKLEKGPSWWDQLNLFVSKGSVDSSLGNLLKSKKHAESDLKQINEWRNRAMDAFVGKPQCTNENALCNLTPPPYSPNHFERHYGLVKRRLPPLDLSTRNRLCDEAKLCKVREEKNRKCRSQVFSSF